MVYIMYCVKNTVEEICFPPFCAANNQRAKALFEISMRKIPEAHFAEEYALFQVGTWDDKSMAITGGDAKHVCNGKTEVKDA